MINFSAHFHNCNWRGSHVYFEDDFFVPISDRNYQGWSGKLFFSRGRAGRGKAKNLRRGPGRGRGLKLRGGEGPGREHTAHIG